MSLNEDRYYQIEAKEAVFYALNRNITTPMVVGATGTGKSRIGVNIAKEFKKLCWLTHTEELIEQSAIVLLSEELNLDKKYLKQEITLRDGIIKILSGKLTDEFSSMIKANIGIIKEDLIITDKRITVASTATIWRRLNQLPPDLFDIVIVDECHHAGAVTWTNTLSHFKPKLRLGLTATPFRSVDDMSLQDLFEEIVYEYPIAKGIKDGYLCRPNAIRIKTSTNLDAVHTRGNDFVNKELSEKVNTPERNILIVRKYQEYALGRPFVAFCCNVEHAIDLCETFNELGIKANYVVGDKELSPERKKIVNEFLAQDYINDGAQGLINCYIMVEGFDYEDCGCLILACPTKSKTKFWQSVGRGLRKKTPQFVSKFSQDCIILDIVDNTTKHKLVNTDTEDRSLPLEDKIFISDADRTKLLEVKLRREQQLNVIALEQDEKVDLIPLPVIKVNKYTAHLKLPAYPSQLKQIAYWGYDIENISYTIGMIGDIYASQAASIQDIQNLASVGYDVSNGVTVSEAKQAYKDTIERDKRKSLKIK